MDRNEEWFRHRSEGAVLFEPKKNKAIGRQPDWAIMLCDQSIVDFYYWFLKRMGISAVKGTRNGAHVSFIKSEPAPNKELWGTDLGPVEFWYSNVMRANDRHIWIDVWSPRLNDIRVELGLPAKPLPSFHMTIGRLE